jgi:formylglycine-generating enzyme required for sulfatase activity
LWRGGDWYSNSVNCRASRRRSDPPDLIDSHVGFRVVRNP